jgi:hypothetical protein
VVVEVGVLLSLVLYLRDRCIHDNHDNHDKSTLPNYNTSILQPMVVVSNFLWFSFV